MEHNNISRGAETRKKVSDFIRLFSEFLELILAFVILIGILIRFVELPEELKTLFSLDNTSFNAFIDYVVDLVIGVELVHLLCKPNLDSVVEILLVALTREIIRLHSDPFGTLLYIVALGIVFLLRRFLFVDKLDRHDSDFALSTLKEHWAHTHKQTEENQKTD